MDVLSGGIFHYKKDLAYNISMDYSNRKTMLRRTTHSAARRVILWVCQVSTPVLWAGVAYEDILSDSDNEADNVAAVEEAEAHLANGAAAGRAAVAAAGASEVASAAAAVSQALNVCCASRAMKTLVCSILSQCKRACNLASTI
jgi:hypothetical protein